MNYIIGGIIIKNIKYQVLKRNPITVHHGNNIRFGTQTKKLLFDIKYYSIYLALKNIVKKYLAKILKAVFVFRMSINKIVL